MGEPARRPDVIELPVDEGLLVYDPAHERIHVLNPSAAAIWELLDGSRPLAAVASAVHLRFPDAPDDLLATVVEPTVATFASSGLLGPVLARPARDGRDATAASAELAERPPPVGSGDATSPTYDALGHRFDLSGAPALVDELVPLLASLADGGPTAPHHYGVRVDGSLGEGEAVVLSLDGRDLRRVDRRAVAITLFAEVNGRAVAASGAHALVFHAAAVATAAGAVLLAGRPNAGKSTLAGGLAEAGLGYITDEAAPVDLVTLAVTAYPKPIGLDTGSWDLFRRLGPPPLDPSYPQRWWLRPDRLGPVPPFAAGEQLPLAGIVVIRHGGSVGTTGERVHGTPSVVGALAPHLFNLAELGPRGLEALVRLAETVPCHRLDHDGLAGGVGWFLKTFSA